MKIAIRIKFHTFIGMSIPRPSSKNEEQNRNKRRRNASATRNFSIIDGSQGSDLLLVGF